MPHSGGHHGNTLRARWTCNRRRFSELHSLRRAVLSSFFRSVCALLRDQLVRGRCPPGSGMMSDLFIYLFIGPKPPDMHAYTVHCTHVSIRDVNKLVNAMDKIIVCHSRTAYVLPGESNTDQASPRTPTQRTFQPQEAVQPQRNQTILQADTPAQKANYSYKWSHCIRVTLHCNCKCRSEACAC